MNSLIADGTCVLVGVPSEKVTIYTLPIHFNKVLTGSHGGDADAAYRHSPAHPAHQGWAVVVRRNHYA